MPSRMQEGREERRRVPISSVLQNCAVSTSHHAVPPSLPFFGEIPTHHCPPAPSILSTMLSSLPMPQNSALFPWPQLNPAQRISLTCYVSLSMGVDSSSLHEGTKGCSKQAPPCPYSAPILVSVLLSPDYRRETTHQCELTFNYDPDGMPIITL